MSVARGKQRHLPAAKQFSRTGTAKERFWRRVVKTDGCWNWIGATLEGYGTFHARRAHRMAYEMLVGPIPGGLHLDHLCRNRACVNPAHLEPVTLAENIRRGERAMKTTCPRGHPYDVFRRGERKCSICHREECKRWLAKVKQRAALAAGGE